MIADAVLQIFKTSLFTSLLIGLLLLLIPLLQKRYRAKWRYIAWLVIAVRLLIPINLSLPQAPIKIDLPEQAAAAISPVIENSVLQQETQSETNIVTTTIPKTAPLYPTIPKATFSPLQIIGFIWLAGVAVFLLFQVCAYQIFLRKLRISQTENVPVSFKETVWRIGVEMGICKLPEAVVTNAIDAPVLISVLHPRVLLPHIKYNDEELAFILRHELVHYRRRDMWYKLVLTLATALHWFNPLIYLMTVQAAKDIELACDDEVTRELDQNARAKYGDTILAALPRKRRLEPVFSTHFGSTKENIKGRLRNMFDMAVKRRGIAALCAVVVCALTITGVATIGNAVAVSDSIPAVAGGYPSPRLPIPDGVIHASANDGTWAAASGIEGKTWDEQLNAEIKWLEDTYKKHNSNFVITETLPMAEASDVTRINYLYENSDVFRSMSQMKNGAFTIMDHESFSRSALPDGQIFDRIGVMVDSDAYLQIDAKYTLTEGKMTIWLVNPSGKRVYWGDLTRTYNEQFTVQGEKGLWNVILVSEADNGAVSGTSRIIFKTVDSKTQSDSTPSSSNMLYSAQYVADEVTTLTGSNNITVKSIKAGEVTCIGKIELGPDIVYTGTLSVENGSGYMIGICKSPEITRENQTGWYYNYGAGADIRFQVDAGGTYYVYVGSKADGGTKLTNVKVNLVQTKSPVDSDGNPYFQIKSNEKSILHSGSFEAKAGQTLTITATSSIKGGTVDFFLFSPAGNGLNETTTFTFGGSNAAKTIELSAGRWAYNCTGFFESGDITITCKIAGDIPSDKYNSVSNNSDTEVYDKECLRIMENSGTWGDSINRLLPNMSAAGVKKVVDIYLERHLFPNITTPQGARQVASTIEPALKYMTKEAQESTSSRISAYY